MTPVFELARRQHGVWSVRDAQRLGLSTSDIRREQRSGLWVRLHRGVYVDALLPTSALGVACAATKAANGSVASHATAAAALGLSVLRPGLPHLTVPRQAASPQLSTLQVSRRDLTADERVVVSGVPMTALVRTVADVALSEPTPAAVVTIDSALHRHALGDAGVEAVLDSITHRHGAAGARAALELARPGAESALETLARLSLIEGGLPEPALQHPVTAPTGVIVARLDLAYEEWLVGLECDGAAAHDLPRALFRDRERQNTLLALGWVILRVTWADVVRSPDRIVALVRAAVASQQARLAVS